MSYGWAPALLLHNLIVAHNSVTMCLCCMYLYYLTWQSFHFFHASLFAQPQLETFDIDFWHSSSFVHSCSILRCVNFHAYPEYYFIKNSSAFHNTFYHSITDPVKMNLTSWHLISRSLESLIILPCTNNCKLYHDCQSQITSCLISLNQFLSTRCEDAI